VSRRANGDGQLRQRTTGLWEGRYSVWVGGALRQRSVYAASKDEAAAKLRAAQAQRDRGVVVRPGQERTVAEFTAFWLASARSKVRPRTLESYGDLARLHLLPHLGRVQLTRLRPEHVQRMESAMLAAGLSAKTVRNAHFLLHDILGQALRWDRVAVNVVGKVEPPRLERTEMRALSADEARRMVAAAEGHELEALLLLAVHTGMRQGELLALRWPDVDLEAGRLRVAASMVRLKGRPALRAEPKSDRGRRTVLLTAPAVVALRRHRREARVLDPRGHVFADAGGGPLSASTVQKRWRRFGDGAGLPPEVRFHDLRHTWATLALEQGIPLPLVAEQLGHDPAVTMRTYAHVTTAMHERAAALMGDLLGRRQ
jgi:integrase